MLATPYTQAKFTGSDLPLERNIMANYKKNNKKNSNNYNFEGFKFKSGFVWYDNKTGRIALALKESDNEDSDTKWLNSFDAINAINELLDYAFANGASGVIHDEKNGQYTNHTIEL